MKRNIGSSRYLIDGRDCTREKNDCTVRALSIAASIPYEVAWLALTLCGRRKGSGIHREDWIAAYQNAGLCKDEDIIADWNTKPIAGIKISELDNVIVHCQRHIYAIKDGKHSDAMDWNRNPVIQKDIFTIWRIPK